MNKNQKTKTQKGITLVALVITVIVLLILAVVAIRAIQNDSIINYAKNSVDEYERAQGNEQSLLQGYIDKIEEKIPGATTEIWTQEGTVVKNTKTGQTLNVGDYVNYVSGMAGITEENFWRILGAENGEILLISSDVVGTVELKGRDGYNSIAELNLMANEGFGKGKYATGARLVDVDDINRVTGYNPETATDRDTVFEGTIMEYGKTVTYSLTEDGYIAYTDGGSVSGTSTYTVFIHPDGRVLISEASWNAISDEDKAGFTRTEEPITVTNNGFVYDPANLGYPNEEEMATQGYTSDKVALTMLFGTNYVTDELTNPTGYTGETIYWLASVVDLAAKGNASFGVSYVSRGHVISRYGLWDSQNFELCIDLGVRPVVSLESKVTLTSAGAGYWTLPTE